MMRSSSALRTQTPPSDPFIQHYLLLVFLPPHLTDRSVSARIPEIKLLPLFTQVAKLLHHSDVIGQRQ